MWSFEADAEFGPFPDYHAPKLKAEAEEKYRSALEAAVELEVIR